MTRHNPAPAWLRLHEMIDRRYFFLTKIIEEGTKPISPLDAMVDAATGHDPGDELAKAVLRIARQVKRLKGYLSKVQGCPVSTEMEDELIAKIEAVKA
jgi:hypothetical protein